MYIITSRRLKEAWAKYPDSKRGLELWNKLAKVQTWDSFADLKASVPFAPDQVGNLVVFDIGGNKYRLIVYIDYEYKKVFIRDFLTHTEYNKDNWKKDEWY
jgi:mRNA interferase HigB